MGMDDLCGSLAVLRGNSSDLDITQMLKLLCNSSVGMFFYHWPAKHIDSLVFLRKNMSVRAGAGKHPKFFQDSIGMQMALIKNDVASLVFITWTEACPVPLSLVDTGKFTI